MAELEDDDRPVTNLHPVVEAAANTGNPDPAVQMWQAQAASMIQDHLQQQAVLDQAQQQRQQVVQGTAQTRDNLVGMVRNDPNATDLAFKLADHFTEALGASNPDAGPEAADGIASHFRGEIAKAAVQGYAATNEGMARAALDRYGEHLSDAEKTGLDQYIGNMATFRQADAQAAQINQHHAAVQISNQGTAAYMSQLTHPQNGDIQFPPGWGQQVMQDQRLAPDAKAALFRGYTALQQNGEPLASDPNLVTNLLERASLAYNHPDHPLTPEIAQHLGTGLTMADAQFLASKTGPQSSAARLGTQQLVQTMDDAREQIGNPRAYARFVDWLLPAVRNGAILDPSHKDYLLTPERMAQFQPTGDDVIAPAIRSGPRPPLGAIFAGLSAGEYEERMRTVNTLHNNATMDPVLGRDGVPLGLGVQDSGQSDPGITGPETSREDTGDPVIRPAKPEFNPGLEGSRYWPEMVGRPGDANNPRLNEPKDM